MSINDYSVPFVQKEEQQLDPDFQESVEHKLYANRLFFNWNFYKKEPDGNIWVMTSSHKVNSFVAQKRLPQMFSQYQTCFADSSVQLEEIQCSFFITNSNKQTICLTWTENMYN